jgi:predicted RNA-binding protein associated with RNAse of E/G family
VSARTVQIHYRRPPDRLEVFEQTLVFASPDYAVTYLAAASVAEPMLVAGRRVLEPGSPIVWFTYPGAWHDIGRFHLADGSFTGIYADILTPVRMEGSCWRTTDLFLDLWLASDGSVSILDRDELEEAEARGWIDPPTASRARRHAAELARAARSGSWPPHHVREWTLERVLDATRGGYP